MARLIDADKLKAHYCGNCEEREDVEHKADNTQSGERVCSAES